MNGQEEIKAERAVLLALCTSGDTEACDTSLKELRRLSDTAGCEVFCEMTQQKSAPDPRTCIGSGKVEELAELCRNNECDLVIFDGELSPSQIRNLEDALDGPRVIDRSMLILDIFAQHATSSEGKLQVELAQLRYTIPRLSGKGTELSRLGGGIGTRGPGESKLESDRRHLHRRIAALEAQMEEMTHNRMTKRHQREKNGIPKIAIAGYTNAGKSTLLNALTGAGILAEDKLFATLDPTTRKFSLPDGTEILLTDTVGFLRNLPHHLIRAFRSTLEEVAYADVILLLIDASDPEYTSQLLVTEQLLHELGADEKPVLYVLNKTDLATPQVLTPFRTGDTVVAISARTGAGLEALQEALLHLLRRGRRVVTLRFGHNDGAEMNRLYENGTVKAVNYDEEGSIVIAELEEEARGLFARFIIDEIR